MTEKYGLPFEIVESKDTEKNKIKAGLKKIEIFASPEQVDEIISVVESLELEATLYDSHGYGQSKQKIRSGKAGGQTATISTNRKTIVTIAESDLLEDLKLEATLYDSHGYGQSKQKRSGKAGGQSAVVS